MQFIIGLSIVNLIKVIALHMETIGYYNLTIRKVDIWLSYIQFSNSLCLLFYFFLGGELTTFIFLFLLWVGDYFFVEYF